VDSHRRARRAPSDQSDGKTIREARRGGLGAPHLVAALAQVSGTVLGQLAVAAKRHEILAVRTLLANFDMA